MHSSAGWADSWSINMKIGEDLHMSIRSIIRRPLESLILILAIGLGIGVAASGFALAFAVAKENAALLSETRYREIIVTTRDNKDKMDLPAVSDTIEENIILTSEDLSARDDVADVEYAYVQSGVRFRTGNWFENNRRRTEQQQENNPQESNDMARPPFTRDMEIPEEPEGPRPVLEEISGYEVSPEFFGAHGFRAAQGSLFTQQDMESRSNILILGSNLAKILFKDGIAMDRIFLANMRLYTVTGVLESTGTYIDDYAFAPSLMPELQAASGMGRRMGRWNTDLHFTVKNPDTLDEARARLTTWFNRQMGAGSVTISIPREEATAARDRNSRLVIIVVFLAFSGLLIASVNVSNILFSRALRKRKSVGILKALGASKRDIFILFFVEAFMIAIGGICLGIVNSLIDSHLMETTMGFGQINIIMLIAGILISWLITLLLTILPALQVSGISAADAIRFE